MSQLPKLDSEQLRAKYPDVFERSVSTRLATPAMIIGAFAILVFGLVDLDFSPSRLISGLHQLGWITLMMIPPDPGSSLPVYFPALGETLSIALLGTTIAAVLALPVSLLAARNIVPSNILRFPVRRFLDSIRGVDTLIWALVWINVVGLGPFAGVLAIAVSDFGAFGKLFSEAIEAADRKQVEGIRASGGSALHEIRFGLMPQVLPVIAGQVLYFIESNTRSATIIGIVGAGGIGLQLAEQIRVLAEGIVPDPHDPDGGGRDRLDLKPAALCHYRTARRHLALLTYSPPRTRRVRRQSASVLSRAVYRRCPRRCCRPRGPDAPARGPTARHRWRRRQPR